MSGVEIDRFVTSESVKGPLYQALRFSVSSIRFPFSLLENLPPAAKASSFSPSVCALGRPRAPRSYTTDCLNYFVFDFLASVFQLIVV